MKTAISLPDNVFMKAELLSHKLKKTRSAIYREAMEEYVARHDSDAITEAMDCVVRDIGETKDSFRRTAAKRVLKRIEW